MDWGGGSHPDQGYWVDSKDVRAAEGNSGNALVADSQGGCPWSGVGLVATSSGASGPCVGYPASGPCLALVVGVAGHHLELIVRAILVGNELKLTHCSLPRHHTLHIKRLLWAAWVVSGAAWWVPGLI